MTDTNLVFPIAALVVLVLYGCLYITRRRKVGRPVGWATLVWTAPFALALVCLTIVGSLGLWDGWLLHYAVPTSSLAIGLCGIATLSREDVWDLYDDCGPVAKRCLCVVLVLAIVLFALLTVEVPYNTWTPADGFGLGNSANTVLSNYFWLEALLIAVLLAAFYFLGQRHASLCGIPLAFFFITGIGQYFIKRFKNAAILPSDLMALGTAAAVSKEYVYAFNDRAIWGIACAMACVCALSLVRPPAKGEAAKGTTIKNLGVSAASFALLATLVCVPSYRDLLGVQIEYWYSIPCYQIQGFYPTFITVWQDMPIRRPQGYTDEAARTLTTEHADVYRTRAASDEGHREAAAQFEREKPTVIAVMNESFSDLSVYDGMHAGYEGPEFFRNGFGDALTKGKLNVTVHGAGTCNSEFEFLTGNALGYIGVGKYPFSIYDLTKVDGIASEFKQWGYDTCAMHPNYATNWNRDKVYPLLGFDTYLSIDDFGGMPDCEVDKVTPNEPHCEVFHSGVSDRETYNRVLQLLDENPNPQFIFDVTMANHGSYDQGNIPAEYQLDYEPDGFADEKETTGRLNEFLSCIKKSDDDLREFVEKLRALDRPVVLIFFGDHQPNITLEYNDYWYTDEPQDVHARRAFSTSYVVWANYDVAGCEQVGEDNETSVDMLTSIALDLIGAPVSDYQAAQLDIRESIPSLSATGYQGADRQWYMPKDDSPYRQAYDDMAKIEYLNFATKI